MLRRATLATSLSHHAGELNPLRTAGRSQLDTFRLTLNTLQALHGRPGAFLVPSNELRAPPYVIIHHNNLPRLGISVLYQQTTSSAYATARYTSQDHIEARSADGEDCGGCCRGGLDQRGPSKGGQGSTARWKGRPSGGAAMMRSRGHRRGRVGSSQVRPCPHLSTSLEP